MRIRIASECLASLMAKVGSVVERRQTLPILGYFLLKVAKGEDKLEVIGTDLEVEVRATNPVFVEEEGAVCIPARKMTEICRSLPEGEEVLLETSEARASIVAGSSRFTLFTLAAGDFPVTEGVVGGGSTVLKESALKALLGKAAFAMAQQDVRYYLNGLLLEFRRNLLIAVATDGHRLAKVEETWTGEVDKEAQIILPRKAVTELLRLLGRDEASTVRMDFSEKVFRAEVGEVVITSKVVDGRYPEYDKVIPRNGNKVAYVNREVLKQALVRTAILANEKFRGVRLSFEEGRLMVQTQNAEKEEAEEYVRMEYAQEPTLMSFNVGYVIDVLNVLEGKDVEITFNDSNSSAVMRSRGKLNETFVVMPMRL